MNNYKGIILAAGRGSRMGDLTNNSHKCLTILDGESLLDWQLKAFTENSIYDIDVIVGYKSSLINGNFNKIRNDRWSETNMVASLFCKGKIQNDTIVSYSDIVFSKDHISRLMDADDEIVITADKLWKNLWSIRFDDPLDDAESLLTENGFLKEIGKSVNSINKIEAQYMGLIKFTIDGWNRAFKIYNSLNDEIKDNIDMTSFLEILINHMKIKVIFVQGKWCEVDSISDLNVYEEEIKHSTNWSHDWRDKLK